MSWRTVVISNRCKLDFSMGYVMLLESSQHRKIEGMKQLIIDSDLCEI